MRVALFVGYLGDGGAERQLALLARGLARRGHSVALFTLFAGGHHWQRLEAEGEVELTALFRRRGGSIWMAAWQRLQAPGRLRRQLRGGGYEVLYSFLYVGNLLAFRATGGGRRPLLVWGLRASDVRLGLKERPFFRLGAWASRRLSLVITNSHAGLEIHRRRGFKPRSWAVVPNGIDTERFRPPEEPSRRAVAEALRQELRRELGASEDELLVGVVARLHPMKDHANFFDALARLPAPPSCVLVGGGAPAQRRRLEALAAVHGVEGHWVWRERVEDMPALYGALDLLCLPSAYGEGFPNVLGEAMACEVPCVTTAVGDAERVVGETGWVVPPRRPEALASALKQALALGRRGLRQRGTAGRQRIEERFTAGAAVVATEALLLGELAARSAAEVAP